MRTSAAVLIFSTCLSACDNATEPDPERSPIDRAYQTAVTLTSSTCTGITVLNQPTIIDHEPGASTFTLRHATLVYTGTLGANSTWTTDARSDTVGSATHTLTIVGQFNTSGFVADVNAQVTHSDAAPNCSYQVHWVGTR